MNNSSEITGILVINKPKGPTSHSLVLKVRKTLKVKAGHTGTLDPMATGVLPILLGKATRVARFYQDCDKEYRAEIELGVETDTYDAEGTIIQESSVPNLSDQEVLEILQRFQGKQRQLPPMYSAVKVSGKRLYKSARNSEDVERPLRDVVFHRIQLVERSTQSLTLDVHCSSGTYIRSLAFDIGRTIGCGAHLTGLIRTSAGPFNLDQAILPEELEDKWREKLIRMEHLLPEIPKVELSSEEAVRISHGNSILCDAKESGTRRLVFNSQLIAIGESKAGAIQPTIVLKMNL